MTKADTPVGDEVPARFATGGHDAEAFGAHAGYPKGDRATFRNIELLVGSHSHLDEIFPARLIHRAPTPSRLVRITEPKVTYRFQGASLTVDDYLARTPTTGLLVARGNTILVERYQYGRTDRHRLTSWSMAKTVTAMLVGIAIAERCIRSVDDLAATYVPELAGTEYGRTSLRHLLQMSSGVRFSEEYTGGDDIARLAATTYLLRGRGGSTAVRPFNDRAAEAGTRFSYASAETQVLGLVLRGATDRPVAEYLQSKVWQEIGTEADASWLIDNSGQEATCMGLNAVLRDYGRLGLLLAHDGNWEGRQIIPAAWVMDATTVRGANRISAQAQRRRSSATAPDLDPSGRTPDVHALGHTRAADLRGSSEQACHGEHRRPQAARRSSPVSRIGRALVRARTSARRVMDRRAFVTGLERFSPRRAPLWSLDSATYGRAIAPC